MNRTEIFEVIDEEAFLVHLREQGAYRIPRALLATKPVDSRLLYVAALRRSMELREQTGKRYAILASQEPLAKEGDS